MNHFNYIDGHLHCEEVSVDALAQQYGTPLFIYSKQAILQQYNSLETAFAAVDHRIHYSMKANPNLSILTVLRDAGVSFEIVSEGEIHRAKHVNLDFSRVMFAGVGKTRAELNSAIENGLGMINIENSEEVAIINELAAKHNIKQRISIRVNPDVDPKTHKKVTTGKKENKFGLDFVAAESLIKRHAEFPHVDFYGLHSHLGSIIREPSPYVSAMKEVLNFKKRCESYGVSIRAINTGGGFGVPYHDETVADLSEFADAIIPLLDGHNVKLLMEPGRFFLANSGICVGEVLYIKDIGIKRFVIQDVAMTEVVRPTLYDAYHRVEPTVVNDSGELRLSDVVGPVCESGDFIALERMFPLVQPGDKIAVFSAGAYCSIMSSNYNSRNQAAEVLVDGDTHKLIRRRERYDEQWQAELDCL